VGTTATGAARSKGEAGANGTLGAITAEGGAIGSPGTRTTTTGMARASPTTTATTQANTLLLPQAGRERVP
jgi:hypothetical protein